MFVIICMVVLVLGLVVWGMAVLVGRRLVGNSRMRRKPLRYSLLSAHDESMKRKYNFTPLSNALFTCYGICLSIRMCSHRNLSYFYQLDRCKNFKSCIKDFKVFPRYTIIVGKFLVLHQSLNFRRNCFFLVDFGVL